MLNFCTQCGGPLVNGTPHQRVNCMSWFRKQTTPTSIPEIEVPSDRVTVEHPYQANNRGDFFCPQCGWSPLATWSHTNCELSQLEKEGE